MDQEAVKTRAEQVARGMMRCRLGRGVTNRAQQAVVKQAMQLAVIVGDHAVHGVACRPLEGRDVAEAVEFVLFTDVGVLSVPVARGEYDSWEDGFSVYIEAGLRVVPADHIRAVSVGVDAETWMLELPDPPFTVEVDGLGDVLVDRERSDQTGVQGELFDFVRGVLASRR